MLNIIDNCLKTLLATAMAAMVGAVLWQVISRYFLGDPSGWTEELARMLLVWLGILGGSYAYRTSSHLGLDILMQKIHGKNKLRLGIIIDSLIFLFAAVVMVYGGASLVLLTYELEQVTAVLRLPVAYIYCVLPISGVLISIFALHFMRKKFGALTHTVLKEEK